MWRRMKTTVPEADLLAIRCHFHELIHERAGRLLEGLSLELPSTRDLIKSTRKPIWFPIPGMYGGFKYKLDVSVEPTLVVISSSRVVGGSGQRHLIKASGYQLVAEGFV